MEAQELRIGNLINIHGGSDKTFCNKDQPRFIGRITSLDINGVIGYENINRVDDNTLKYYKHVSNEPIPLTEEWLIKFEFEDWGWTTLNEHEKYRRWVLHNVLDGTSNLEVHEIHSNYGGIEHKEFVVSVDNDERMNNFDLEFVHTFQNITYLLLGYDLELTIKDA